MLLRENVDLKIKPVLLDVEAKLLDLAVSSSDSGVLTCDSSRAV